MNYVYLSFSRKIHARHSRIFRLYKKYCSRKSPKKILFVVCKPVCVADRFFFLSTLELHNVRKDYNLLFRNFTRPCWFHCWLYLKTTPFLGYFPQNKNKNFIHLFTSWWRQLIRTNSQSVFQILSQVKTYPQ